MRISGLDVLTVQDTGMQGKSDPAQLAWSARERRTLVTYDRDFLALDACGQLHAGIIHMPPGNSHTQELIRLCLKLSRGRRGAASR